MAATAAVPAPALRAAITAPDAATVRAALANGRLVTATRAARNSGHTTAEPAPAHAALDAVAQNHSAICPSASACRFLDPSAGAGAEAGGAELDSATSAGATTNVHHAEPAKHARRVQATVLARGKLVFWE